MAGNSDFPQGRYSIGGAILYNRSSGRPAVTRIEQCGGHRSGAGFFVQGTQATG